MITGRIKLFHSKKEGENAPYFDGEIEYVDGTKERVALWVNEHPRVKERKYYTGQIKTIPEKIEEKTEEVKEDVQF